MAGAAVTLGALSGSVGTLDAENTDPVRFGAIPCQCTLTSGTLSLNGESHVYSHTEGEGESTDKPTTSVVAN